MYWNVSYFCVFGLFELPRAVQQILNLNEKWARGGENINIFIIGKVNKVDFLKKGKISSLCGVTEPFAHHSPHIGNLHIFSLALSCLFLMLWHPLLLI